MNKWLVTAVLALSVLTSAIGLKAMTAGSFVAVGQAPMPRPKVMNSLVIVRQAPMPRPKIMSSLVVVRQAPMPRPK